MGGGGQGTPLPHLRRRCLQPALANVRPPIAFRLRVDWGRSLLENVRALHVKRGCVADTPVTVGAVWLVVPNAVPFSLRRSGAVVAVVYRLARCQTLSGPLSWLALMSESGYCCVWCDWGNVLDLNLLHVVLLFMSLGPRMTLGHTLYTANLV